MKQAVIGCGLFGIFATAAQYQNWLAVVLVAAVWALILLGRHATAATGYMEIKTHGHSGAYNEVCAHEGGHADGFNRFGGGVIEAKVTGNENSARGHTVGWLPNDPASRIGIYLAGFAAAPGTGSQTDHSDVDGVLATVPRPYRGAVLREGQRLAAKAGKSSQAAAYARTLRKRGRL